jgi:hypothetical protein
MRRVVLTLLMGLCLAGLAVPAHAQLQVTYSSLGVDKLKYNGVTLTDTTAYPVDAFSISWVSHIRPDKTTYGEYGYSTTTSRNMDTNTKTMTWSFSWGNVKCLHEIVSSNRLNLTISITNSDSVNTLAGCNIMPFLVRFPNQPTNWDPAIPQVSFNMNGSTVVDADYGTGKMVFCNDDPVQELYSGLFSLSDTPTTHRYFLWASAIPFPGQPAFWEILNRPIPPGGSDKYTLSLRFAASGTSLTNMAGDVFDAYRVAHPYKLIWPDRRPIALIHLAAPAMSYPNNPRGWFQDSSINIYTAQGLASFQARILALADDAVVVMQSMNAQGMIVWDIEGEQYPHATSYPGSPDMLPQLAPEIDPIADAFFKKFTDAGFKVGCCVRPQQLVVTATNAYQDWSADPETELTNKIAYASNRWHTKLFYGDSNGSTDSAIDARIWERLQARYPDTLFVPEHQNMRYYAYTGPYCELDIGEISCTAKDLLQYPQAFVCQYPCEEPNIDNYIPTLVQNVRRGDVLIFRGWFNDTVYNPKITSIYQQAGDVIPPTVIVTNPVEGAVLRGIVNFEVFAWDNTGKPVGVRFRVDGTNYGVESTNYPYATNLNTTALTGGAHTLDAVAHDITGLYNTSTVVHVTVDNTNPCAWVSIAAGSNAAEPSTNGSFTVTRSGVTTNAITVSISVSGSATEGTDYQPVGSSVTMGAGVTSVPITITPIDDTLQEGTETITVTLRSGTGYGLTTTNTATINLIDNEVLVIPPGLVGWWRLDETGGTNAEDKTGNGNTGVLHGGSWYPTSGYINGALGFMGSQYADCGAGASLNTPSVTVAFWMKPYSIGQMIPVGKIPNGSGAGYVIKLRSDGAVWFRVGAEGGTAMDVYGGPYADSVWTHVAATFDNGTKKLTLYLNGALSGSQPTLSTTLNAASTPLTLSSTTEPYNGLLDDVRVYNYALSQGEIQGLVTSVTQATTIAVWFGSNASEPSAPGSFTIVRSGNTNAVSVNISMSGTATAGADYQAVTTPVNFGSGVSSVQVPITPIDDLTGEGTETVILNILPGTGYVVGAQSNATINLLDNDSILVPVGWWKLDESAGTTAADSSGHANNGTLTGGSWSPSGGHFGGAIHLNAGNVVNCGTAASLNTPSMTVAFWMKPDSLANVIPVDKLPATGSVGYAVKLRDTGTIWFRVGAEGGPALDVYGGSNIYTNGVWTHVACTFDAISGAMRMYINGVVESHQPTFSGSLNASNTAFRLGSVAEQYAGLLDDVRLYDVALSATDIQAIMTPPPGDADWDGILDSWETNYFPSISACDPNADVDGDGLNNMQEYIAGTVPTNASSLFKISDAVARGSTGYIYWPSVSGRNYAVYRSTNITKAWDTLPVTNNIAGDGTTKSYVDSTNANAAYYRLGVTKP